MPQLVHRPAGASAIEVVLILGAMIPFAVLGGFAVVAAACRRMFGGGRRAS